MEEEIIKLDSLSCFEAEKKIAERYDLGEIINSSSFSQRLKPGACDNGMVSTDNGSLEFNYIVDELDDGGYTIKVFPKEKSDIR